MGADFHAEGYERNRATIEVFAEQAHLAGIVRTADQRGRVLRRVSGVVMGFAALNPSYEDSDAPINAQM